jgi:3-keto-disaccharide hydrolase
MHRFITPVTFLTAACLSIVGCAGGPTSPDAPGPDTPGQQTESHTGNELFGLATKGDPTQIPYFNPLTPEQIADGWISLFDGYTTFGWRSNSEDINWHVVDGTIAADSGPIGLLVTDVPFADFELLCDFRMSAGGNSGIFLRTVPHPADVLTDCYELNIADEHPNGFTTGAIVGRAKTEQPIAGSGGWKTFHVRCEGNHFTVQLDGEPVLDYTDESNSRRSGFLGLQKNEGRIEFRNILLKPLGLRPLFNGEDLTGWHVVPGPKSQFTVEDGTIHVVNGQGFLETDDVFGNFVFQADAVTHGDELNSGYFFRAEQGTEQAPSNGYEVQIHNGFEDDDRTRPNNAGTGAIFRRTEARRVVSSDHEWFTTTLIAAGPRMAVWVDGYQVTDWEDTREPDENPRRGRRDEAGHISLQGHDPTTDLSFRRLRIVELP